MNTQHPSLLTGPVHRIVVKVGFGVLTRKNSLNIDIIASLSDQICRLCDRGIRELTTTKFVAWGSGQIRI